ncbi:MAG: tRNA (5-methylaminomethyl-2-thiouridine)(34)-methyltransferase MnmD [Flavobacteriales bacterium]|nr:tRNA (5-methylaminomethyl-2-thiouridine)(34)-methyltransferase MnmD [Flavobacteriales bacterium]
MDLQSDSIRVERTKDGSATLYSKKYNSHYHSTYGAIQESRHVFIGEGMSRCAKSNLKILEVGFGTGLNALLSLSEAIDSGLSIDYHSIELHPLPVEIIKKLDYCCQIGKPQLKETFYSMHEYPWDAIQDIQDNFKLTKYHVGLSESEMPEKIDLVFYDAFGPGSQPELWDVSIFKKIYSKMSTGGVLTTYCSKGDVRRAMISVGFKVEKVPGPPGKREMLVATK